MNQLPAHIQHSNPSNRSSKMSNYKNLTSQFKFNFLDLYIIISPIIFLYFSGIGNYIIGNPPLPCIGVCNKVIIDKGIFFFILGALYGLLLLKQIFASKNINFLISFRLTYAIAVVISIYGIYSFWGFELDDKWLIYKVSNNILKIGIPTWNLQDQINVSTSLIWPYLSVVAHALSGHEGWNIGIKALGLFIFFMSVLVSIKYFRKLNGVLPFLLGGLATYIPICLWELGGLETSLTILWSISVVALFYTNGSNSISAWIVLAAGILIRPEFGLASCSITLIYYFSSAKLAFKVRASIITLSSICIWGAYNKVLYNDWLPTPAYIKSIAGNIIFHNGQDALFVLTNGSMHYLSSILISLFISIAYFLFFKTLYASLFLKKSLAPNLRWLLCVGCGFISIALYHSISGYLHMGFTFRYLIPTNVGILAIGALLISDWKKLIFKINSVLMTQCAIFVICVTYVKDGEFSLTRATHRDAFSLNAYAGLMNEWKNVGIKLKEATLHEDKLWMHMGANLAGGAISNMYSLDGLYMPLMKSHFSDIRNCQGFDCAQYFNYIILQGADKQNWKVTIPNSQNFSIFDETSSLVVLKNQK